MSTECLKDGSFLVVFLPSSLCLPIVLIIFILSIKQLKSHKVQILIKALYFIACVSGIIAATNNAIASILCVDPWKSPTTLLFTAAYCMVIGTVLVILLLRLYFTFKGSMFEISKTQKWFFIIICTICIISVILLLSTYQLDDNHDSEDINAIIYLRVISMCVVGITYFVLSVYGMFVFAQKMNALAKMGRSSSDDNEENIRQKKLLYVTTKYVTLLSVALLSTWISVLCGLIINVISIYSRQGILVGSISFSVGCIDSVINISCLYLQYPFNKKYYDQYCQCFSNCCTYLLTKHGKDKQEQENVNFMKLNTIRSQSSNQ